MNNTIDYYNRNADSYYRATVGADLDATRKRFASYLPAEARVIDMGCGSGRDVLAFRNMGFNAVGLDASEELVELATERLKIPAIAADMSTWIADEPYDGIWCCASLMHLSDNAIKLFFSNLKVNLASGGVVFMSVKSGVDTGMDCQGRYFRNFTEDDMREMIRAYEYLNLEELWYTEDTLARKDFRWLNVIAVRS